MSGRPPPPPPPPPSLRTNRTRRVRHPVLIGHAARRANRSARCPPGAGAGATCAGAGQGRHLGLTSSVAGSWLSMYSRPCASPAPARPRPPARVSARRAVGPPLAARVRARGERGERGAREPVGRRGEREGGGRGARPRCGGQRRARGRGPRRLRGRGRTPAAPSPACARCLCAARSRHGAGSAPSQRGAVGRGGARRGGGGTAFRSRGLRPSPRKHQRARRQLTDPQRCRRPGPCAAAPRLSPAGQPERVSARAASGARGTPPPTLLPTTHPTVLSLRAARAGPVEHTEHAREGESRDALPGDARGASRALAAAERAREQHPQVAPPREPRGKLHPRRRTLPRSSVKSKALQCKVKSIPCSQRPMRVRRGGGGSRAAVNRPGVTSRGGRAAWRGRMDPRGPSPELKAACPISTG